MFVPSMEDFAKMAQAASTPFSGRGFIPEEDENTCAVDLLFKKPTLPTNKNEVSENSPPNVPQTQQQGAPQMTSQEPQQHYVPQTQQQGAPQMTSQETSR